MLTNTIYYYDRKRERVAQFSRTGQRRWPDINTTFGQRLVFAVMYPVCGKHYITRPRQWWT